MKRNGNALRSTAACAALTMLASGCAATSPGPTDALICAGWTPPPIQPQDVDVVSDPLAVWLAQTVEYGRARCGW